MKIRRRIKIPTISTSPLKNILKLLVYGAEKVADQDSIKFIDTVNKNITGDNAAVYKSAIYYQALNQSKVNANLNTLGSYVSIGLLLAGGLGGGAVGGSVIGWLLGGPPGFVIGAGIGAAGTSIYIGLSALDATNKYFNKFDSNINLERNNIIQNNIDLISNYNWTNDDYGQNVITPLLKKLAPFSSSWHIL